MKNALIAVNWKSNKTKIEAKTWIEEISLADLPEGLDILIFPPFTLLDILSGYIKVNSLPFKLGAQDLSPFESGAYTGEISALQIKEFASHVLIGHSERRNNFGEDNRIVNRKIEQAISEGLNPIVCVSNLDQVRSLTSDKIVIAYEPLNAIGTGEPEDPKLVFSAVNQIKQSKNLEVLYGGSVDPSNIKSYASLENISGVLVGGQSLETQSFIKLINNVI